MDNLIPDLQKIVYRDKHNIEFSEVMNELNNATDLEVEKMQGLSDYYNTEVMHFNLPNGRLSTKIHAWDFEYDPITNPCNDLKMDYTKRRIADVECPHNVVIPFKYVDDKRHLYY